MRARLTILAGLILCLPLVGTSASHADSGDGSGSGLDAAQQAAKQIADARDRADRTADLMFQAESKLDQLQVQQDQLAGGITDLQQRIAKLRTSVEHAAINRFTRSGTSSLPLLTGFRSAGEQAQVVVLTEIANDTSADDFDRFEQINHQLLLKQHELADVQSQTIAAKAAFDRRRAQALADVQHLKDVEAQRMQDDAVRKALAAELAERARQAVAAKAAAASSTTAAPTTSAANRKGAVSTVPGDLGASDGDVNAQDTNGSIPLGGDVGGQTGKGGVGSRPAGADATDFGSPTWVCPVQGPVAFADTWGAPRSGGRVHQGVDMIGERGLPVVAVVDGFAQQNVNELGGNTVLFTGTDGNKYYYAHLDSWANLGQVTAGTVIGYLGQTGNAQFSVPHLHFEIHPGGGEPADPYPTVRAHCV